MIHIVQMVRFEEKNSIAVTIGKVHLPDVNPLTSVFWPP